MTALAIPGKRLVDPTILKDRLKEGDMTYGVRGSVNYGLIYRPGMLNALDNGVTGDGSTNDVGAINTLIGKARSENRTIFFPDGTYLCGSAILLQSNVNVVCSPGAIFKRTFKSTGASGLIAQSAYKLTSDKISNVSWRGGLLTSPDNSVTTYGGNMVGLYGDHIYFSDLWMDSFGGPTGGGGRAFAVNGDHIHISRSVIKRPNTATGNGGIRVTGGTGFVCTDTYCESGDVVFQFVPSVVGPNAINDTDVTNGTFSSCVGYSFNASLLECGVGNQTNEVNDGTHAPCRASVTGCSFVSCKGTGANGRAVIMLNPDSAGTISNIRFVDCDFQGAIDDATFPGVVTLLTFRCSGGIDTVDFVGCNVTNAQKTALYLDGSANYTGPTNATLDAQTQDQNVRNVHWLGGKLEAPQDGTSWAVKAVGTRGFRLRDVKIIANGNDAIQLGTGTSNQKACYHTIISGCRIEGIANSQYGVNNQVTQRTIVENCNFVQVAGATSAGAVRNAPASGAAGGYNSLIVECDVAELSGTSQFNGPFANGSKYREVLGYADADFISAKKTADTVRTNTNTLADDAHIVGIAVAAGAYYKFSAVLHFDEGGGGGNFQFKFVTTGSGVTLNYTVSNEFNATVATAVTNQSSRRNASTTISSTAANARMYVIEGELYTSTFAGTLTLQWAQNTSNATGCTLYTGSHVTLQRLP